MNPMNPDPIEQLRELSIYLEGVAAVSKGDQHQERLNKAATWLRKASQNICGRGYFGCFGGPNCNSDHK